MSVHARIDSLRKQKGIKWGFLNDQIGGYHGKLSDVKNGKTTLNAVEIVKLAEILETTSDYLLGATDDPQPKKIDSLYFRFQKQSRGEIMFFERLQFLCDSQNTDISNVLRNLNLSTSKGTAWKKGSIPSGTILLKLAAYFHVSTDYLLGATDDPSPADGQKEALFSFSGWSQRKARRW